MPMPQRGPECIYSKQTLNYSNGWTAIQKWKMGYEFVAAFIGANVLTPYPGTTTLRPQQFEVDPLAEGQVLINPDGTPDYTLVTINFALDYLDVPFPNGFTRPAYATGTTLKFQAKFSGQFLTLPTKAVKPDPAAAPSSVIINGVNQPAPPPVNNLAQGTAGPQTMVLIPLIDFEIEQDRIAQSYTYPNAWVGMVNETTFLGQPAETVLFEGIKIDPTYLLNQSTPTCYKMVANFKCRKITVGANTYGWNHDYLPLGGWTRIKRDDGSGNLVDRYTQQDFTSTFT